MPTIYAGFWRRLVAWIIDGVIVLAAFFLVGIFLWPDLVETTTLVTEANGARLETTRYAPTLVGSIVLGIAAWAYVVGQESAPSQSTLGKRLLRLRVTRLDGSRPSLIAASYRSWPRWLPSFLGVVAILDLIAVFVAAVACAAVAFSNRKQGVHDLMARCLVVRRNP
jgi:uncharacterized RDD family membrane protein YckC